MGKLRRGVRYLGYLLGHPAPQQHCPEEKAPCPSPQGSYNPLPALLILTGPVQSLLLPQCHSVLSPVEIPRKSQGNPVAHTALFCYTTLATEPDAPGINLANAQRGQIVGSSHPVLRDPH